MSTPKYCCTKSWKYCPLETFCRLKRLNLFISRPKSGSGFKIIFFENIFNEIEANWGCIKKCFALKGPTRPLFFYFGSFSCPENWLVSSIGGGGISTLATSNVLIFSSPPPLDPPPVFMPLFHTTLRIHGSNGAITRATLEAISRYNSVTSNTSNTPLLRWPRDILDCPIPASFSLLSSFQQVTVKPNFTDDWIWTEDLWYQNRPLCLSSLNCWQMI